MDLLKRLTINSITIDDKRSVPNSQQAHVDEKKKKKIIYTALSWTCLLQPCAIFTRRRAARSDASWRARVSCPRHGRSALG